MQPVVFVTADRRDGTPADPSAARVRPKRAEAYVLEPYVAAVRAAGGLPLIVPPGPTALPELLARADAVVLTGGDMDIHPSHYGREVAGRLDRVEPERTELELAVARYCLEHDLPVLGVCGGMQVLAVAAGGTLIQDLPAPTSAGIAHEQPQDPATVSHPVHVVAAARFGLPERLEVNSTHHQAVERPGAFDATGHAPDGVIEVITYPTHRFALGVQWHPELLGQLGPYRALVDAARGHTP